jgi:DNA primase
VYEYYCKLTEQLTGQRVNLKSPWNANDTRPSFFIYYDKGYYVWKDFSTGKSGNHVHLVMEMFNLSLPKALSLIEKTYTEFLAKYPNGYTLNEVVPQAVYKPTKVVNRVWNNLDAEYWLQFGIGSAILERFNVKPIKDYVFATEDNSKPEITISRQYTYGYYTIDGSLAKIYQPKVPECKFVKVQDYIQGTDQLQFNQPNLVICSSLKDAMSLSAFGYNLEVVAPDSENTVIRPEVIDIYKKKFQSICILFDNDRAGIESMTKYKAMYNIPMVHFKADKDLSDAVKSYGIEKTRQMLTPLLKEALKK